MNLHPDRFSELEALLARVVTESERLRSDAERARALFLDLPWVGPAAEQAADRVRALVQHIDEARSDATAMRALVADARRAVEAAYGDVAAGFAAPAGLGPEEEDRPVVRPRGGGRRGRAGVRSSDASHLDLSIYLSDDDEQALQAIRDQLSALLLEAGFEPPEWREVHRGSLWQRGRTASRRGFPKEEVVRRLETIERALQVNNLDLPQSQANQANAQAVAAITAAHAGIADVVLQLGSLVYVKWTDPNGVPRVLSRTLSVEELIKFEASPHLLSDARAALAFLQSDPDAPATGAARQGDLGALPLADEDQ